MSSRHFPVYPLECSSVYRSAYSPTSGASREYANLEMILGVGFSALSDGQRRAEHTESERDELESKPVH